MDGDRDHNVFEALGLDPPEKREEPDPTSEPFLGVYVDFSEDIDVFVALGCSPLPDKPQSDPKPPSPKRVRRWASFEAQWEDEEKYWKQKEKEWKEKSQQTLLYDEPLYTEDDPFDTGPRSVPHR